MRARRARKCARTPKFFNIQEYDEKSLCNFFLLWISQKLTILVQFEFCWKIKNPQNRSKSTKNAENACILCHFEDFWFFSKIQIELKSSIFEILTKEKNCTEIYYYILDRQKNFGCARTSARGARAFLLSMKTSKMAIFWHVGRIFYGCARASARAPKFFQNQKV